VEFNQRPTVDAGPDFTNATTNSIVLNGTAQDDGLPIARPLTKSLRGWSAQQEGAWG